MQKMSKGKLVLIKQREGLRLNGCRDAIGAWTIWYGYVSAAGEPLARDEYC